MVLYPEIDNVSLLVVAATDLVLCGLEQHLLLPGEIKDRNGFLAVVAVLCLLLEEVGDVVDDIAPPSRLLMVAKVGVVITPQTVLLGLDLNGHQFGNEVLG